MADQLLWTSPDGTTVDLTDWGAGFYQTAGATGLSAPTYQLITSQLAGVDGVRVDGVRAAARELSIPMYLQAPDRAAFRVKARALVRTMRAKAGPGTLAVVTDGGERRTIACYCTGGLEGDRSLQASGPGTWWRFVLKLTAPDPWWLGEAMTLDFGLAAPSNFFPITPVVLSPSTIQGQLTVDLSMADDPSFPVWTITGPGSALTLTNLTTNRTIQLNAAIGDGQTVVIDTRPGMQSVRRGDGTNLMGALSSDPALWPLIETVNQVSALLPNAVQGSSRIAGVYRPRYSGA